MMKNKAIQILMRRFCMCAALFVCVCLPAMAQESGAQAVWLEQFASALHSLTLLNAPEKTADPARAGEYLMEYEFGTVLSKAVRTPSAQDILEIDVRGAQVTDWRGNRVGMSLQDVSGVPEIRTAGTQLYVLGLSQTGYGWQWAYVNENGVYGVEYIDYVLEGASATEYTLTYVISGNVISAIRIRTAQATQAQAEEGMNTAREIASRQQGEVLAARNDEEMLTEGELRLRSRGALGGPVEELIAVMGEPEAVQTLPHGAGRILAYDGAAVTLGLDERTGVEIVRGVSVSSGMIEGPRRLLVGMSVQEAAALFRCDADVSVFGGTLYLEGEAAGEPPYGMLEALPGGAMRMVYACLCGDGKTAVLEAGIEDGFVSYWQMHYSDDTKDGV